MKLAVGFFATGDVKSPNTLEMPVRLSAWTNSAPTEGISAKFDIGHIYGNTRVGTLMAATIYLQLIQNRYMFRSFTLLQCSHQHCVQPVASDVEVLVYL